MARSACVSLAAVLTCLLAIPAEAPAATSCTYSSSPANFLEVRIPATGDRADLRVSGGEIQVINQSFSPVDCDGGTPTVSNTDVISIFNQPGAMDNDVFIGAPGSYGPGATTVGENGGTPEIEIFINLNNAANSELQIISAPAGESVRVGTSGINPNATSGEAQPDADIFPKDVPSMLAFSSPGNDGPDTFGAQGGAGTGGPLTTGIRFIGGGGNDTLVGGEGGDVLEADQGNDTVSGLGGPDVINPDGSFPSLTDDDNVDGGSGTDLVSYLGDTGGGVTVDLAVVGGQSTGGGGFDSLASVEDLEGSTFADVLRGDSGPNLLRGQSGNDVLDGRGGVDVLEGGESDDSLDVRDGGADTANCGSGADSVTTDSPGIDSTIECENVLFPPTPVGGDGGGGGGGAGGGGAEGGGAAGGGGGGGSPVGAPDQARDARAAVISGVRSRFARWRRGPLLPRFSRAPVGTTISFRLDEGATATLTFERVLPGRRVGRRCVAPRRSNRNRPRCTRSLRAGTLVRRNAPAGLNRVRFHGRLSRTRVLALGRYRVIVAATDAAGNRSRPRSTFFTIVAQ